MTDSTRMLAATYTQGGALSIEDYRIAMKLVAGKRVDLSRIVSDIFPLSALPGNPKNPEIYLTDVAHRIYPHYLRWQNA